MTTKQRRTKGVKAVTDVERIYREIREQQAPYFDKGDIEYYLEKNHGDVEATIYEMLIIKSEDSKLEVSGLITGDSSSYFKRLADRHKPFNSGTLLGG